MSFLAYILETPWSLFLRLPEILANFPWKSGSNLVPFLIVIIEAPWNSSSKLLAQIFVLSGRASGRLAHHGPREDEGHAQRAAGSRGRRTDQVVADRSDVLQRRLQIVPGGAGDRTADEGRRYANILTDKAANEKREVVP